MLKVGNIVKFSNTNRCQWSKVLWNKSFLVVSQKRNENSYYYLLFNKNITQIGMTNEELKEQKIYNIVC